jgi:predicted DNA-binding protein
MEIGGYFMSKEAKKTVAVRLSDTTIKELNQLTKRYSLSQASVISVLIHFASVGEDMEQLDQWLEIAKLG